jgi:hypothetical protein
MGGDLGRDRLTSPGQFVRGVGLDDRFPEVDAPGRKGTMNIRDGEPRTLLEAQSAYPVLPPAGASAEQQREFYARRAEMFMRIATVDPDHKFEALACVGLEREKAEQT